MHSLQKLFLKRSPIKNLYNFCSSQQTQTQKFKILFFGSDDFPHPILQKLHSNFSLPQDSPDRLIEKLEVVTHVKKDKQKKITNKIQKFALENEIPLQMPMGNLPQNTKETRKQEWKQFYHSYIKENDFNLGIVCSYGYMVPSYIIKAFTGNMIVIHPSLLPKYRGAAPMQHALFNGEQETGVSFIKISILKFDAGEIIHQTNVNIDENATYKDLSSQLSINGAENVLHMLKNFDSLERKEQKESERTPAPLITPEDLLIDFKTSAQQIYNQYRALKGSSFSAVRAKFSDKVIFFESMSLPNEREQTFLQQQEEKYEQNQENQQGRIFLLPQKSCKNNIYIKTGDGNFVVLKEWKVASGKPKKSYTFTDQYLDKKAIISGEKQAYFN